MVQTSNPASHERDRSQLASGDYADVLTTDFETEENIASRNDFGVVFNVQLKSGLFSIKKISNLPPHQTTGDSGAEEERKVIPGLQHPNILRVFDFGYRDKDLLFIMEFADGGDLCSALRKNKAMSVDVSMEYGLQIIQGLVYLHTRPQSIAHRNIKTENVLLVKGVAKLTDFEISVKGTPVNPTSRTQGLKNWSPPEAFEEGKSMGLPSDVYSYGLVIWSMVTGEYPYEGMTDTQVCTRVISGNTLSFPSPCNSNLVALVHKCWEKNLENRISAPQVELELKQIISSMASPPRPKATAFRDMKTEELVDYLDRKGANSDLIEACKENKLCGLDFLLMTQEDVKQLLPQLKDVQVRAVMVLVEEAKSA